LTGRPGPPWREARAFRSAQLSSLAGWLARLRCPGAVAAPERDLEARPRGPPFTALCRAVGQDELGLTVGASRQSRGDRVAHLRVGRSRSR
jgi:hypothetical protein